MYSKASLANGDEPSTRAVGDVVNWTVLIAPSWVPGEPQRVVSFNRSGGQF